MTKDCEELILYWQARNIEGLYCGGRKEAYNKLMEIIPVSASKRDFRLADVRGIKNNRWA